MKKVTVLLAIMLGLIVFTGPTDADALDLPANICTEFDLDNWTRLYDENGIPYPVELNPVLGLESRAFLIFNDISPTLGPGGGDVSPFWVGGTNGEYLYGWEENVELFQIVPQANGALNLYFDHVTFDTADPRWWEIEVVLSEITEMEFQNDPNYIPAGPANFDTIKNNIVTHPSTSPFIRGRFADSVYFDPVIGPIIAAVAIKLPNPGQIGGEWINQVTIPFNLGVNAFVDVDPTVGVGSMFTGAFYGYGPDGSEYDLAIQNVLLNSETDAYEWIISDDGVRGCTFERDEPGVCRVTGGGWDDIYAVTIPPPNGLASIESNGNGKPVYSFGGQAGAPSASSTPPYGEWQHNFGKGRGPNNEFFSFHGGTSSSPKGIPGTQIISITCSDEGWCFPAREAPFHSIYFDGCGTFQNAINVEFELGKVHYFKVHIDDLGEGPGKLDATTSSDVKASKVKKNNGNNSIACPDHDDLHPIDPDTGAPECAQCDDWYEIHIYPGVEPTPADPAAACEAAQALAQTAEPIHSVASYINGGNLQIHPPTGADAKK
jgi:hypothetical protein